MDFLGHVTVGIFWLVLAGLFLRNITGATTAAHTVLGDSNTIIKTLEGPPPGK